MKQPSTATRSYHAPEIRDLGTVRDLTQTGGTAYDASDAAAGYVGPGGSSSPSS